MTQHTVQDLYEEYIFQRGQNVTQEQAVQLLFDMQPDMSEADRQELAKLIREWERQNRHDATITQLMQPLSTGQAVVQNGIICKNCSAQNPAESKYCYSCGQLLVDVYSDRTDHLPQEPEDPALFGSLATLVLLVRGHEDNPLRIRVDNQPMVIGRSDKAASMQPNIDFAPYGAKELGVSRRHAILKWENQTLTLIDQDSANHTFINGERIHPHEVRVIRDGDELRFGRLVVRVAFHRELRRL